MKQAYSKLIGHIWPRTFWLMRKSLLHRAVSFVNWLETLNWVEWNIAVQNKCVYAAFSSTLYVTRKSCQFETQFSNKTLFCHLLGPWILGRQICKNVLLILLHTHSFLELTKKMRFMSDCHAYCIRSVANICKPILHTFVVQKVQKIAIHQIFMKLSTK